MRVLIVAFSVFVIAGPARPQRTITLAEIFATPPPHGFPPRDFRLSPDGERMLISEVDRDAPTGKNC